MSGGTRAGNAECRARVLWSPRGRRRWCPGAARAAETASARPSTGWTAYLQWQTVVAALRGRRAHEESAQSSAQPSAQTHPQPRAALPDRRRRAHEGAPPLDGWLERTADSTERRE